MEAKAVFITGATRGVGLAIAKRLAQEGAMIAFVGKTATPHPKLPGTLDSAAAELTALGAAKVLAINCDVRDLDGLHAAITQAGEAFGRLDVIVNNASALYLMDSTTITPSKFNLMHEIIVRASLFATQFALPYLAKAQAPKVIQIAPKPILAAKWFKGHTAYTICKYSAAMLVIGLAEELKSAGIAVNAIWPKTLLATAAVANLLGGDKTLPYTRDPKVVADAVAVLLAKPQDITGNFYLDEELLQEAGVDLASYATVAGNALATDLYVEE